MRDSALKRLLVETYFGVRELGSAVTRFHVRPSFPTSSIDYDGYWSQRQPTGLQPRFLIITEGIKAGESVLDVGCGDGSMLEYLRSASMVHGTGIDISEVAVRKARERGVDARATTIEAVLAQRGPSSFDHVVLSEVIEHVQNAEDLVRAGWQLSRLALWLTFPNIAYLPHRLRLLFGRFPKQWVHYPGEHVRYWSLSDFRDWLRALGFPEANVRPSNGLSVLGFHRLWPNLAANQIVVCLRH
jgi:methionine biosynthesis protein MetW